MIQIFQIIVLVFSAIIHEYMHGFMADRLGDPTAKQMGRLTLNPIPHIDLFGSIIMPLLMIFGNFGFVFGWAKPVPFNPYNLKDQRFGPAKVALAGPVGNLILALMFGLFVRFVPLPIGNLSLFLQLIVYINLVLAIFNLVPIPPMDGSRVLAAFLPPKALQAYYSLERYGMFFILLFVIFGYQFIAPIIYWLFKLITGLN
jgi:Zn-dependent protease